MSLSGSGPSTHTSLLLAPSALAGTLPAQLRAVKEAAPLRQTLQRLMNSPSVLAILLGIKKWHTGGKLRWGDLRILEFRKLCLVHFQTLSYDYCKNQGRNGSPHWQLAGVGTYALVAAISKTSLLAVISMLFVLNLESLLFFPLFFY